jgi:transcriptional regulator with PAS, ATPase and Fis domain
MVGGTKLVRVDVRVIAATNKRLQDAVAAGKFREDLFYRLEVLAIQIPPLRDRAEDIPVLLEDFLKHFAAKHKRPHKHLTAPAMELCQRFLWPGNVRQLRNMVERLIITHRGITVDIGDLPEFLRNQDTKATAFHVRPGMSLAEVEKLHIRQTLTQVTDNREQAARALGISRRALQYKLKQYGLLDRTKPDGAGV